MNFFSAGSNPLSAPLFGQPEAGLGAPFLDSGAALARLAGTSQLSSGAADLSQFAALQMLQMTAQMLEMLTMLMVGAPNSSASLPSLTGTVDSAGASPPSGARIPGGKSNYAHGMFHKGAKGAPNTYAFENSPAGIKFAAEHGYSSIDIDMQITKDGVPVATHWSQPMQKDGFFDPEHKLKPNMKVSEMTLAEVMRLRNKDGRSQIYPVATMIGELKKHGIAGDFEAKDDPRFATNEMMGYLANLVRSSGIKANLKTIYRGPRSLKILEKAQQFGFWVRTADGGKGSKDLGYG
ncbi:MAG: hypothetical protein KF760_33825 [Candidatus Eremiobacteraeota bacterium]|nr:hypothetical protein [Candidatus Eremiobacteraeota bacterium]MCW5872009.1 hypothetical protein [Candidatus Eremiobacteraeota bacterium]